MPEPTNADGEFFRAGNRRRNLFLTAIGPCAFAIVQAAALPYLPNQEPIHNLMIYLRQHFQPQGMVEANRFAVHQRL